MTERNSSRNSLNTSLQSPDIRTTNALHLLAILHENESGHSSDIELGSHTTQLIDIDLHEANVLVLLTQLTDLGSNGAAGTTPGGVEVDNGSARVD
jgi:hypothetical protein